MSNTPNYLSPTIASDTSLKPIRVVDASDESLRGLGCLIHCAEDVDVEIVRWPAGGWRPVDEDSGDQGGTHEGEFVCQWRGDVLFAENRAVNDRYILGYSELPDVAEENHQRPPRRLLLWHANYHPDGGQLFVPRDDRPYMVPLAPPGDDVKPDEFICFRVTGGRGIYLHPNVWHEGVFPLDGEQVFFDRQGAVHAPRVSVDFPAEFGCLLEIPLGRDG